MTEKYELSETQNLKNIQKPLRVSKIIVLFIVIRHLYTHSDSTYKERDRELFPDFNSMHTEANLTHNILATLISARSQH